MTLDPRAPQGYGNLVIDEFLKTIIRFWYLVRECCLPQKVHTVLLDFKGLLDYTKYMDYMRLQGLAIENQDVRITSSSVFHRDKKMKMITNYVRLQGIMRNNRDHYR